MKKNQSPCCFGFNEKVLHETIMNMAKTAWCQYFSGKTLNIKSAKRFQSPTCHNIFSHNG